MGRRFRRERENIAFLKEFVLQICSLPLRKVCQPDIWEFVVSWLKFGGRFRQEVCSQGDILTMSKVCWFHFEKSMSGGDN